MHERSNLEKFNRELKITSQKLMRPKTLQIEAASCKLLDEYEDVFEFNGLKFKFPDSFDELVAKGGDIKIELLSLPQSCDLQFEESDFYDLLTEVRNYDTVVKERGFEPIDRHELIGRLRPKKVNGILALKACKAAITVGKKLE